MEISLAPEPEARLGRIASEAGKAPNQLVQELVADYLDHDEWFRRELQKGLASLDSGKFVSHEEVGRQIERILKARGLTQVKAAKLLKVSQPRISDLMRGRVDAFSIDTLVEMLARLGVSVTVRTKRSPRVA